MSTPLMESRRRALAPRLVPPRKLAHFVVNTSRFEEMVAWYKIVLCAQVSFQNDFLSFLTYDDEHHRVAIARMPNLSDRQENTSGINHIAFTFASLGDSLSTYIRLKQAGLIPSWTVNHGPTLSFYYLDPDKNRIELQVDTFAPADLNDEFVQSSEFAQNPIGVDVDPDELIHRFAAGESVTDLTRRARSGPRSAEAPRS